MVGNTGFVCQPVCVHRATDCATAHPWSNGAYVFDPGPAAAPRAAAEAEPAAGGGTASNGRKPTFRKGAQAPGVESWIPTAKIASAPGRSSPDRVSSRMTRVPTPGPTGP